MNSNEKSSHFLELQTKAKAAEGMLKLLANANRLLILCNLINSPKNVSELVEITGLSQSAVSQHLAKMRENNLITSLKNGLTVTYHIQNPRVEALLSTLYLIYCN